MPAFQIESIKSPSVQFTGTLAEAIAEANRINAAEQSAFGVQVMELEAGYDDAGDAEDVLRYDTEWPKFKFRTDGESGTITAPDFDHAVKQLNDMFTEQMLEDGAFGWVEDHDGYRHNIGEGC
jgi:hypothetical protein